MEIIKTNNGNIIKIFAKTIEYDAYDQIKRLGNFEAYVNSKIRIMPDCHAGSGCTIGTTMEIVDKITPNLVGVDIGCGMLTIELGKIDIDVKKLDTIINEYVPHGFNGHDSISRSNGVLSERLFNKLKFKSDNRSGFASKMASQLGTLGGGNHFIEVNKGSDDTLYLVVHTGSRNAGNQVARYHQNVAWKNVNEMGTVRKKLIKDLKKAGKSKEILSELRKLKKPKANKELAYLTDELFDDYMNDMKVMQEYATLNRRIIVDTILKRMELSEISSFDTIHNYIDFKRMILRKGSVSAEKDEIILIPMNMRDGSLICKGKGNPDWNYSAPHGAGRLMSRSKAKQNLDLKDFKKQMKSVYSTSVMKSTLDEAPDAYKPMDEIIEMIGDTAEIVDILKPIYNFKSH